MYLGIDLGTSAVKAIVIDDNQHVVSESQSDVKQMPSQPPKSEQEPQMWISAVGSALDKMHHDQPAILPSVRSIGLSGHMHGAVLVDKKANILRPCIMWDDGRSTKECMELANLADFEGITGNLIMAGFTAPKLRWVKKNEPELFAKTCHVLLPKDYLRLWLTGELASDMSDASGTLWMDIANRDWSDELLKACDLDRSHMPHLVEGIDSTGHLRRTHCQRWGMRKDTIVVGGAGDNAAAACGMGIVDGSALISLGTSGVVFAPTKQFRPHADRGVHAFCHAVPDMWHQMGVILSAASCLDWFSRMTLQSPKDLLSLVKNQHLEPTNVIFLPFLTGNRTPYNNPSLRASFTHLSADTKLSDMMLAVLQGVAFALHDCLLSLQEAGTDIVEAFVVGGGSQSKTWLQIIANTTDINLLLAPKGRYGSALGAARLAAAGCHQSRIQSTMYRPPVETVIEPEKNLKNAYADAYDRFTQQCEWERARWTLDDTLTT